MKTHILKKNVRVLVLLAFVAVLAESCQKEDPAPDIPYIYVNFSLNPDSPEYDKLNVVTGWETVYGGYNGILIFRKTVSEFVAFERACPYDPLKAGAQIKVDDSGLTCSCPVCGSGYIMTDGTPYQGPSRYPLKQYQTVYDGMMLYISN